MKRISEILESMESGTPLLNTQGITNRYTPIQNIVINLKNYFGATYGIVVTALENNSIVLRCSRWINTNEASNDLSGIIVGGKNILSYAYEQGLQGMKMVAEGDRIATYLYPLDINNKELKSIDKAPDASEYTDIHANEEYEILIDKKIVLEGKDDDEEMEDETLKELREIITSENKVKSAEMFAEIISQRMNIPNDYYFKAVKDKDGNESIALRYKTTKRRPFGKKADIVTSVMNIYGEGDEAIWVDGYDNPETMPEDMKVLIENILTFLQAQKTTDPCVYSLNIDGSKEESDDEPGEENRNEKTEKDEVVPDSENDDSKDYKDVL